MDIVDLIDIKADLLDFGRENACELNLAVDIIPLPDKLMKEFDLNYPAKEKLTQDKDRRISETVPKKHVLNSSAGEQIANKDRTLPSPPLTPFLTPILTNSPARSIHVNGEVEEGSKVLSPLDTTPPSSPPVSDAGNNKTYDVVFKGEY